MFLGSLLGDRRPTDDDDEDHGSPPADRPMRSPFPPGFPIVIVSSDRLETVTSGRDFVLGKRGDAAAAARLASLHLTADSLNRIRNVIAERRPTLLAPFSASRNRVPLALADLIGAQLGLQVDDEVVKVAGLRRAGASMFRRLWCRCRFSGLIQQDQSYILVDDVLTQGGTLADLRGYVESRGGEVIGAIVLTAAKRSSLLRISDHTLRRLRERVDLLEPIWTQNFGFGFESLTNSEGRALLYFAFSLSKSYCGQRRKARGS